ncbi:MAG: 16S rRNA (cytosine(967)-C(5))-methyltransferase RsmB [Eubacteriales bacterium]
MENSLEVNNKIAKTNARLLAVRILSRVDKEKSYANLLLRSVLKEVGDPRDRHFVTALVNGVLKNRTLLDYVLRKHLSKPLSSLPMEIREVLRIGAFQILFMDNIPDPVAVNESVNTAKSVHTKYSSLVNGVLHRVSEIGWNFSWPDKQKNALHYLNVRYSHPEWMLKRWLKRWGLEETEKFCIVNNRPSPTCIRTNALKTNRRDLAERLKAEGIVVEESAKLPQAMIIKDFGAIDALTSFREGHFTVQDESSQLGAYLLGAKPGDRVLDVCSAPGGKTSYLAEMMENKGSITAVDIYSQKLELVKNLANRLGINIINAVESDARVLEGIEGKFDRVLVDAPCSGLGVLRRRADLRWHKLEDELEIFPEIQLAILMRAAEFVRAGGELVYSTCTVEPVENFEVVKAFRKACPWFEPVDLSEKLPFVVNEENDLRQLKKGVWQILPQHQNMDGFFIAKFCLSGL